MVVLKRKSDSRNNKDNGQKKGDKKERIYVRVSSRKAVFLVTGEPKESKYSIGVPVIPLHGYYKSKGKSYTANELRNYYVVLNLDKENGIIPHLRKGVLVTMGYKEDDVVMVYDDEEEEEESNANNNKKEKE